MNLKKRILCVIISIIFVLLIAPKSNAASMVISFSNSSAKVGDTITATVTAKGATGKVNLSVEGNATLSENSINVDGSASTSVKINGEGDVKVTATAADMKETSSDKKFTGSTAGKIKVSKNDNKATNKSNNANLSNLGIKPNDFKGFKISTTSYNVSVPNDVENITIYATAQDKKATIKGTGTQKLKVGKNAINVVVTAQDGKTTKTYTINVTRKDAQSNVNETASNTTETTLADAKTSLDEKTKNSDLKNLIIKGLSLAPEFSPDIYEYKVDVTGDVSKLDIETEKANQNVSVDIAGNENLKEGENTITLLVYNEETKQNSTYQIIVNKTSADNTELIESNNDAIKKANKIRFILIGVGAFIVICIIIFIIARHRPNKANNEMYEYDEDDKERLNLDDEDKLSEYDTEDYFRTNKPKRKGKHF